MEAIDLFARLGDTLDACLSGREPGSADTFSGVVDLALSENPWFDRKSVLSAISIIRETMLQEEKLRAWLTTYAMTADGRNDSQKRIGIVMAGNLPLVGFHDLLCVILAGHACLVKPSTKDSALMDFIMRSIKKIDPAIPVYRWDGETTVDAVIATGSDNTNRYFRRRYSGIPTLLRGSRTSVAVLTGQESETELNGLAEDIFLYYGMGCRNVSKLFVPEGYDFSVLMSVLSRRNIVHSRYLSAFRHRRALLATRRESFRNGGFFMLRESVGFSENPTELVYGYYTHIEAVREWLAFNDAAIQCVVTAGSGMHPRQVAFGQAQRPRLNEYADGRDTMEFLKSI